MSGAVPDRVPVKPRLVVRERLLAAARIARLLAPHLHAQGGWVSGVLRVHLPGWDAPRWPLFTVVIGEPPVDGVLRRAPALVVDRSGESPLRAYLDHGAKAVWVVRGGSVRIHRQSWPVEVVGTGGGCAVLETGVTVPADHVLALLPGTDASSFPA